MYGLQHGALAHTEQQAIKGSKIISVKPFKRENHRYKFDETMLKPRVYLQNCKCDFLKGGLT